MDAEERSLSQRLIFNSNRHLNSGQSIFGLFAAALALLASTLASAEDAPKVLWATYDPPVVRSDHSGPVSVEFVLAGDVPEVYFHPSANVPQDPQRWVRDDTQVLRGELVSVFRQTIDKFVVADIHPFGIRKADYLEPWHFGGVPLGHVDPSRDFRPEPWDVAPIRVPRVPMNLPRSRVEQVAADMQYSSHLVNLAIPSFGDGLAGGSWYDLREVARLFYLYFGDDYQTIAVLPGAPGNATSAYHVTVKNPISGLGSAVMDESLDYGSHGRLRSMHVYLPSGYGQGYVVLHEMAHQWWDFWDWESVTGIDDLTDGIHGPTVMWPDQGFSARIVRTETGWTCETPPRHDEVRYMKNPMTLYKMGHIGPDEVPEMIVWEDQSNCPTPDAPYRTVHLDDFIARHGVRDGPVEGHSWRMATVVVTRDRLLSDQLMSAYNFIAARASAQRGYGRNPSFCEATDGRMRLQTHVRPQIGQLIDPPMPVEEMPFIPIDETEVPGVRFDSPLATRIVVGAEVVVSGRVEEWAQDLGRVCARWLRMRDHLSKETCVELSAGDRFRFEWEPFGAQDVGEYMLGLSGFADVPIELGHFSVVGLVQRGILTSDAGKVVVDPHCGFAGSVRNAQ
ncbi:MAG: hypothetical protein OXJ53_08160 [Gammaproteobacteria bacterium]|nr:hypothetical protein [Gammaproteobacteria bacterium]MDD9962293.1 hypothetical protein [Gammaproteobacteria bacterium]MDE0177689.1 hypothetical protein [Gammaproteobacteria bacterium]